MSEEDVGGSAADETPWQTTEADDLVAALNARHLKMIEKKEPSGVGTSASASSVESKPPREKVPVHAQFQRYDPASRGDCSTVVTLFSDNTFFARDAVIYEDYSRGMHWSGVWQILDSGDVASRTAHEASGGCTELQYILKVEKQCRYTHEVFCDEHYSEATDDVGKEYKLSASAPKWNRSLLAKTDCESAFWEEVGSA
eukprot:TRINITY_DN74619_c0_g1_i1.p1 TRINITY_DN74619_c0_g1~~TRINITY_DN74619_c0_g1_i1.p1  ORF type:complete len:222 (-),score=23.84 TRINITY_DN74619_c0_g1_i1:369-965(-)